MSVSPSGQLSLPLSYLRATIAASTTFQTWVGAENAAAALTYVSPVTRENTTPPFAVIDWSKNLHVGRSARGERSAFEIEGDLVVLFRGAISEAHDQADAAYTFLNTIGAVLTDMLALAGTPGYLDILSVDLEEGPERPSEDEAATVGDFYQIMLRVTYEDGG